MHKGLLATMLLAASVAAATHSQEPLAPPQLMQVRPLPGDWLNLREGPSASSRDLGDLRGGTGPLTIVATSADGRWGRLPWREGNAWVATAYLETASVPTLPGTALPAGLVCHGNEPFWSATLDAASVQFNTPEQSQPRVFGPTATATDENLGRHHVAVVAPSDTGTISITVSPQRCEDGMSDTEWAWAGRVLLHGPGRPRYLSGCCSLPLRRAGPATQSHE